MIMFAIGIAVAVISVVAAIVSKRKVMYAGVVLAGFAVFHSMKKKKGESADDENETVDVNESNSVDGCDPVNDDHDNYPGVCS